MVSGVPFRPGDAVGIVAPWFVAVIEAERGGDLGNALIALSELSAGGVDELVGAVAAIPLADLPDFALGVVELHVVRVIVRGAMTARVEHDNGIDVIDGSNIRTWREESIDRPAEVRIGMRSALELPAYYWTSGGVAPVSTVVVTTTSDGFSALRAVPTVMPPTPAAVSGSLDDAFDPDVEVEVDGESDFVVDHGSAPDPALDLDLKVGSVSEPVILIDGAPDEVPEEADDGALADSLSDGVVDLPNDVADVAAGAPAAAPALVEPTPSDEPTPSEHSDQTLLPAEHWSKSEVTATPSEDDDPYAELWMTKVRAVEDAAVRIDHEADAPLARVSSSGGSDPVQSRNGSPVVTAPSEVASPPESVGDHDGHTRAVASLRASIPAVDHSGDDSGSLDTSSGGVPSSPCVNGHPNPPFAVTCRRCLAPVKDSIERVARADAGVLVLPDGKRIEVDRTIVVGRSPKADGLFTGDPPRLIPMADQHDISRTHVVIELSGWTATVTDQDSMNGTEVQLPGKSPEQLRPHTPMAIVVGTKIVLANEVTLKLEGG